MPQNNQNQPDLAPLLKKAMETAKPDLRGFYRIVKKGRIVAAYPAGGTYVADVQPLTNDGSPDPKEPVVPKVEIPVIWGGNDRGVVCPPEPGTIVDLEYTDGDPNFPKIAGVHCEGQSAPAAELGEFVIQHSPGVRLWFGADGKFHIEAPEVTITAPNVIITGNVLITGALSQGGGTAVFQGDVEVQGDADIAGQMTAGSGDVAGGLGVGADLAVGGDITAAGTNPNHHTHEG